MHPNEQFFMVTNNDEKFIEEEQEDIDARVLDDVDRIVIAGMNTDDFSSINFCLYDSSTCGLETNHLIPISSFPLSFEVIASQEKEPLLAVGSFDPTIDLWNLRSINQFTPQASLDSQSSVLSLSHSKHLRLDFCSYLHTICFYILASLYSLFRQLLASGDSDKAVKIWDLNESSVLQTFSHHKGNVQVVLWHPNDPSLLLSGSFDKKVAILDVREPKPSAKVKLDSDVECAIWGEDFIVASTEKGYITLYDFKADKKVWSIKSHKKPCSSLFLERNLLVSCGLDSKANVFKFSRESEPTLVESKNLKAGPLFSMDKSEDDKNLLSFGGECVVIWDLETIDKLNEILA
ncbi:WD-repeat domain containing protein [Theileria equi strain WA]|uniref:WD-repeat domain containing protein n=1 Tax=Theileria equi strain WA TaxID=1537102 RepID=L1LDL2_THEEQ|nr:WD-repeat domain containing protein [Theileria equi strain WA]EKX73359.1 WD-repeat domain containing protein [Theileria equi strain WA]|eukprot:XP_004832811.1 WD-repeat domain containing protein [Theileria equi strain WA]